MRPPRPNEYRSRWAGELRADDVGEEPRVAGWVHRRRDHGGLSFFDLRDRSGLAQVIFNAKKAPELHQQVKAFGPEYVLSITGQVGARPDPGDDAAVHRQRTVLDGAIGRGVYFRGHGRQAPVHPDRVPHA